MAGLFEKDIRILMQRKKALLLFLALSVFIGYSQDGTFILSYLPMLMIIVMIGTISYDEYDNGYRFLMTLPIDSKVYVSEKYIFCIAGTLVSCIAATLIYLTSQALKGINVNIESNISDILAAPLIMLLFVAILLPLQIKYGAEKSRVTLLVVVGIIAALIFVLKKNRQLWNSNEYTSLFWPDSWLDYYINRDYVCINCAFSIVFNKLQYYEE